MEAGDVIGVPCQVQPGPFSSEHLISCETTTGPISGFVRESELKEVGGQWYVRAVIESVTDDSLNVRIRGSFFTTNGMATVSAGTALAA